MQVHKKWKLKKTNSAQIQFPFLPIGPGRCSKVLLYVFLIRGAFNWFKTGLLPDLENGTVWGQSTERGIKYHGNGYSNVAKLSIYSKVLRHSTKPKVYGQGYPEQLFRLSKNQAPLWIELQGQPMLQMLSNFQGIQFSYCVKFNV